MTAREELDRRRAQLAAREGQHGYKENVAALRARIAELEKIIGDAQ